MTWSHVIIITCVILQPEVSDYNGIKILQNGEKKTGKNVTNEQGKHCQ